jgi:hypothetical protein
VISWFQFLLFQFFKFTINLYRYDAGMRYAGLKKKFKPGGSASTGATGGTVTGGSGTSSVAPPPR